MNAHEARWAGKRQRQNLSERLRSIRREDIPAICDLSHAAGELETISKDRWVAFKDLFYFDFPKKGTQGAPAPVYEFGGRLLAFLGGVEVPFKIGNEIVTAVAVSDLVVHPERKGPFGFPSRVSASPSTPARPSSGYISRNWPMLSGRGWERSAWQTIARSSAAA